MVYCGYYDKKDHAMKRYLAILLVFLFLLSGCVDLSLTLTTADTTTDTPISTPPSTTTTVATSGIPTPENPDCHKDENDDGTCDICKVSLIVVIDFYAINDIHGKFKDSASQNGVDELTAYLKSRESVDDFTVLLSSGDTWQGSSESNLTEGLLFTDWMNRLDFASMTLGNHEYDWGEAAIEKNAALAEFPLLAINVYDRKTNSRVEYAEASVVIDCGGVTVGIIGAIGDCYSSIAADKSEGVYFKTGKDLTALVKEESARLRKAGVDLIVYSLHDGYGSSKSGVSELGSSAFSSYYDTALSNGYVDLVFEAHTHQSYVLLDEYGVYHLQGGGDNKGITHAEVAINAVSGSVKAVSPEYLPASRYASLSGDALCEELLDKYQDLIAKGDEVLGVNGSYKSSKTLCQLVADLYYEAGVTKWGDSYDIALAGAFIKARSPYDLSSGDVTYAELQMIFPFDNQIVLCSIKGRDLRRVFYDDPNENYYMKYHLRSSDILDSATYYVITDTYSSTYSYNRMTEVARFNETTFARDLLAAYIREGRME